MDLQVDVVHGHDAPVVLRKAVGGKHEGRLEQGGSRRDQLVQLLHRRPRAPLGPAVAVAARRGSRLGGHRRSLEEHGPQDVGALEELGRRP